MSEDVTRLSPRNKDILIGRGSDCWNHDGNKQFRITIAYYQEIYHSMSRRADKVELVAKVVDDIQASGARLLKLIKNSDEWKEVDRKFCIEKVGHAIRDKPISKCRINQRAKDPSKASLMTRTGGSQHYRETLEEATWIASTNTKLLDPTLIFEIGTNRHGTTSNFELERLFSKSSSEANNYVPCQYYQTFQGEGDWIVKLLRSATLESLLIKYRQKGTRDERPMNPVYHSSWSSSLLLSHSSMRHDTLSAGLGFHHSTMPSSLPICLREIIFDRYQISQ